MQLTDLEGAALAEIAGRGVATSYAVARTFRESPSEYWSGSAGAVYPLLKRLMERGLLVADAGSRGRRAHTGYALSDAGRAALQAWLLDAKRASGLGFDPLRTRAVHMRLVSPQDLEQWLEQVRTEMQAQAEQVVWPDNPRLSAIHDAVLKNRADLLQRLSAVLREHSN